MAITLGDVGSNSVKVTRRRRGSGATGRADVPSKVLRTLIDRKIKHSTMRVRSDRSTNKAKPTESTVTSVLINSGR